MVLGDGAAPAALALDALWSRNGKLATLSEETSRNCAMHCQDMWRSHTRSICAMTPAVSTILKRWTFCSTSGF
ncbi:hypothetical protein ACLB1T_03780 [Escherichia coli]